MIKYKTHPDARNALMLPQNHKTKRLRNFASKVLCNTILRKAKRKACLTDGSVNQRMSQHQCIAANVASLSHNDTGMTTFKEWSWNFAKIERTFSCKATAELIVGKCGLSQRRYKALRAILKRVSIQLSDYEKAMEHLNDKDVGNKSVWLYRFMVWHLNRPWKDSPIVNRS